MLRNAMGDQISEKIALLLRYEGYGSMLLTEQGGGGGGGWVSAVSNFQEKSVT